MQSLKWAMYYWNYQHSCSFGNVICELCIKPLDAQSNLSDCQCIFHQHILAVCLSLDDVITWKPYLHCRPFVRVVQQSPVNSLHKWTMMWNFDGSLILAWTSCWTSLVTNDFRCDMAFIEPMHRNKPNITYLLTYQWFEMLWHWCEFPVIQPSWSVGVKYCMNWWICYNYCMTAPKMYIL